jgi:hypothetical protein
MQKTRRGIPEADASDTERRQMTKLGTAIVSEGSTAYVAGRDWADALMAGDKFEGAAPEAAKRYNNETEQSMFIAGAMTVLDERALYLAMGEEGSTIVRIERPDPDGRLFSGWR